MDDIDATPHDRETAERHPYDDLVVVTHRGPVALTFGADGGIAAGHAAGGLAPSLLRALAGSGSHWIACAMSEAERHVGEHGAREPVVEGIDVRYLALAPSVVRDAYQVVANETLWFVYHEMADVAGVHIDDRWLAAFERYRAYNAEFARVIAETAGPGATVMVNDYHLPLVGASLRAARPDLRTVHFSHTPFCSPEGLGVLPEEIAREILSAMASFGACGFHTERWEAEFLACADRYGVPRPATFACPLGVDGDNLAAAVATPAVANHVAHDRDRFAGKRVIFRSDRLEPTKNIVRGFDAYERMLERLPNLAREVVFHARAYLSRTDLSFYLEYREEIERAVARVNGRFDTGHGAPIVFEIDSDYDATLAAYRGYDVLLVNPLRDGMNLVAKEAPLLNQNDGAVVLSTEAGAYVQLHDYVVSIDPLDVEQTARALQRALELPLAERARRAAGLKKLALEHAPATWLAEVVSYARVPG